MSRMNDLQAWLEGDVATARAAAQRRDAAAGEVWCFHPDAVDSVHPVPAAVPRMELYPACGVPRPGVRDLPPQGYMQTLRCPDCGARQSFFSTYGFLMVIVLSPQLLSRTHKDSNSTGGES